MVDLGEWSSHSVVAQDKKFGWHAISRTKVTYSLSWFSCIFRRNCLDLHPGNFSLSTPSILWFVSPTSKAPRRPRKVKVMSWPESKTENVAHIGANIFGNVFYRCLPSPATVYVLPECLEFRETFCLVGSDSCCWNCASIQNAKKLCETSAWVRGCTEW